MSLQLVLKSLINLIVLNVPFESSSFYSIISTFDLVFKSLCLEFPQTYSLANHITMIIERDVWLESQASDH